MYRYIWKIKLNDDVDENDFINHWKIGSEILQKYPGAKGTHIHRVRNEPRCFFLIAEWESQTARDAMQTDIDNGDSENAKQWQGLPKNEDFGDITSFAGEEFGVVMPNDQR